MHNTRSNNEVHLPPPSIWPIAVGAASLVASLALIWWSRDRSNALAGILLGLSGAALLATIAGWATQDSRLLHARGASKRAGQVIAFELIESDANSAALLSEIDALGAELRGTAGLQDLRILSSGHAPNRRMMVETVWPSRDALHAFDGTSHGFLDLLTKHEWAVVPGSVEVLDLDIDVEGKDLSPRFNYTAAAAILGGLLFGAAALASGLTLFESGQGAGSIAPVGTPTPMRRVRRHRRGAAHPLPPDTLCTATQHRDHLDRGQPGHRNPAQYRLLRVRDAG